MSGSSPEAAKDLILELVRAEMEARPCPGCGSPLDGCRLVLRAMEIDHLLVEMTCTACDSVRRLAVTPSEDGGTASIR